MFLVVLVVLMVLDVSSGSNGSVCVAVVLHPADRMQNISILKVSSHLFLLSCRVDQ